MTAACSPLTSQHGCNATISKKPARSELQAGFKVNDNRRDPKRSQSGLHIKAIQIHDLVPSGDKVLHKLLLGVIASVSFGDRAKL